MSDDGVNAELALEIEIEFNQINFVASVGGNHVEYDMSGEQGWRGGQRRRHSWCFVFHQAHAQIGCLVCTQAIYKQKAIGDDLEATGILFDRLDVHLTVHAAVLRGKLSAVLPLGLSKIMIKPRVSQALAKLRLHTIELDALEHCFNAERAWHNRVAPEVAAKEPILRVNLLRTMRIAQLVFPAV